MSEKNLNSREPELSLVGRIPICIGVTGHRDPHPAATLLLESEVEKFFLKIAKEYPDSPVWLLTGLAEGADRLVANIFLRVKKLLNSRVRNSAELWELRVALPMQEYEYKLDFPNSIGEFDNLLRESTKIERVSSLDNTVTSSAHVERVECYEKLAEFIIIRSTVVLALWDGHHLPLKGGTSHLIRSRLRDVNQKEDLLAIQNQFLGAVFHIHCPRASATNVVSPVSGTWLKPLDPVAGIDCITEILYAINKFNRNSKKEIERPTLEDTIQELTGKNNKKEEVLEDFDRDILLMTSIFGVADQISYRKERKRRHLTKLIYGSAAAAALFLWTTLDGVFQVHMAFGYLISLIVAFGLYRIIKNPELSNVSLEYRFLAEALRVQFYFHIGNSLFGADKLNYGRSSPPGFVSLDALGSILSQYAREIFWLKEAIRPFSGRNSAPSRLSTVDKSKVIEYWIDSQLRYFRRTEQRYLKQVTNLRTTSIALGCVGLIAAVLAFSHDMLMSHTPELRHTASIMAAVLPAWAILIQSYINILALDEQSKNALRMQWVFYTAQQNIVLSNVSDARKKGSLNALGQEALVECANWLILRKSRPPNLPT